MTYIFIAVLMLPWAIAQAQTPGASDVQTGKEISEGYFNLENDCKLCHGIHGEGGFATSLAGHKLTAAQFIAAVRKGPGIMPAFVADKNLNDQQLTQVSAYLASLPKAAQSTAWQTAIPPLATPAQREMVSMGCGQCHGPIMANPRRTAGGRGADFEWFKQEVWGHTSAPGHVNARHLRMGNYSKEQVSEGTLQQEIWRFFAGEQGLRVPINADVSAGVPGPNGTTYTVNVSNGGQPGKGLTAEYITVTLPLLKGRDPEETITTVAAATGGNFTGVHREPISNSQTAEFEIEKLAPGEKKTFTITLAGKGANAGIPRGLVKWELPRLGTGATDLIGISVPVGQ